MIEILYFILKLIGLSVMAINIAYYAKPIQFIKKLFYLNKLKAFNCAGCMTFWLSILYFFIKNYNYIDIVLYSFLAMLITALIQPYFFDIEE